MFTINDKAVLNNNVEIPYLGLGVYLAKPGKETINAVLWALEAGYRHIDTASAYKNEESVGEAIRQSGIPRKEIFITTKLKNGDQGYDSALKAFDKSLAELKTDYIDLYLIHWPLPGKRKESWKALDKIYAEKSCRSIGVSNYMINHLEELFGFSEVTPVLNQVEFSPFLYQKDLLDYCRSRSIEIEAYSPIARGKKFKDKRLRMIASKHGKTPAQIMIRWAIELRLIVIPKSSRKERIIENADVYNFSLDDEDMQILNSMDEGYRVSWDPSGLE